MKKYIAILSVLPVYASVGAVCLLGLLKTAPELSDQTLWFVYCVIALLGCGVMTWLFTMRRVTFGVIDLAAALFVGWYVACYCIDGSIDAAKLLETAFCIPLYVSLRIVLSSYRNSGRWLLVILCVCGFVEAYIGIQQAFGARYSNHSLFSVTGTFFNPGPYGGYIAIILSLAIGYTAARYEYAEKVFKRLRFTLRKIIWGVVFVITVCTAVAIFIILLSTLSRAAFVAVGAAVIAIVLANKRIYEPIVEYAKKYKTRMLTGSVVALLVAAGAIYGIYTLKKDSADGRLLMWKIAAKVMVENPVTGVGQGYYSGAYGDVQADYFRSGKRSDTEIKVAGCPDYGFNEFLHIGAETGIPGLLLFAFLTGATLWRLFRARSYFAFGLLAWLVFACFSYPLSILPLKILLVVFLAVAGSCAPKRANTEIVERVMIGTILCGCVGVAVFLAKPYRERIEATEEWQEQRQWYQRGFFNYVLEDAPKLLPYLKENPKYLFEYGRSLYVEKHYKESIGVMTSATKLSCDPVYYNIIGNNYKALGEYDKAAESYLKAYYIIPHRMYPLYLLGKMYSEIGDAENARSYATRVVEMIPKIESPATNDMQREMKEILQNLDTDEK